MEFSSSSSESSSSSSSEEESSEEDKKPAKKRVVKAAEKAKPNPPKAQAKPEARVKPDVQSMKEKIRSEFSQAFKSSEKLEELKAQSKEIERPYLNQFDHLLPSK